MEVSQRITRKSASNLALAFILLPRVKRDAMVALYAFCRQVDDVADEETSPLEQRRRELQEWREDIRTACEQGAPKFAVNRELQPVIKQYRLPFELFDDLLRGVEMDLDIQRYPDYEVLEQYCYRVASVVGLLSIEVFGYANPRSKDYAVYLGKALQLTNILRDVKVDAERGRIYLPQEELKRFGVSEGEILRGNYSDSYRELAAAVAGRARMFYEKARQSLPAEDRKSMATAELMGSVYWGLLQRLERNGYNVFTPEPTRLSKAEKVFLIGRTWFRAWRGGLAPNYGTG
jgi:phytoene synthase